MNLPGFNKKTFFHRSFVDRVKSLAQYYIGNSLKIAPPQIITFRFVAKSQSCFVYSGCDGFYKYRPSQTAFSEKHMSLRSFRKLADYAADGESEFFFWGEDISKSEDFFGYLDYLSLKAVPCRILTIGGVDERILPYITKGIIKEIIFSFEGHPSQKHYKAFPEVMNMYQSALNAINLLKDFQLTSPVKSKVSGSMIISEFNYYFLDEMLAWSKSRDLDYFYFFHGNSILPSHAGAHASKFYDTFQLSSDSWRDRVSECNTIDSAILIPQMRVIQKNIRKQSHIFTPDLKPWQISPYYTDYNYTAGFDRCYAPWFIMNVFENGDVVSCANFPDYPLGNIAESSIDEIWNGEAMRKFRSEIMLCDRLPLCTRCSCLYS